MSTDLSAALTRSEATEQIAEILYLALRSHESVLLWDEVPSSTREEYRARAREALRSCLDYALDAARLVMASALATADGHRWDDLSDTDKARYRHRAFAAWSRYRWHLAESAYPEAIERQMASTLGFTGQPLGTRVAETRTRTRIVDLHGDWRYYFAKERP